ncbi:MULTISPECIES: 1-deoxy-D-xylulose-5-phosphate synthase [Alteromonas]|jgi:1-deoxy-D-xylulose-5-phosphate synthase|uniref:1-deoxy-D-xylulose-5-phosphate synthase n=2 Tax=Alteromonas stellipolaris TaxID=233316 RepID=A0AAW7YZ11_9ALTE|nr:MULTISPECIES: 1-deoxy-D-xylulose-5-phosphate synthase [Alteromonas]AMJ91281.1 1-deoxy-D-xylulose-5-phosphate synthase [Alteromonas sp. Mac2]ALM89927.1 1-deoxy-D-xylulose 5-phosphate synthase [Alteromonas stellipolaris LMG 21856]AMJ75014.1 1-deoxy-D-xylulose-5-phosphate synthase [Alteromonas stellipolaris]AMJ87419.1 1-deoxy-D-xylulose-5-phosphate synthase [Alteromonas sp. Mac1]ANB21874.1 1-deoxy-D-xylulose-5-phosphate synthase [Alteromonas stellipolaris]
MSLDLQHYPTLAIAQTPDKLRQLPQEKLRELSDELREYLLNSVSQTSGHFASGLGTVELTVALHYIYNTPIDRLIWDVGHQAYPHKILTGRATQMSTIRQKDGLHPFPWPPESDYDTFAVGHSSTSISAALGMAVAAEQEGKNRKVVAVIGDGAITAGMAFEAMNHAGDINKDMVVVLNDNEMSISENVGALNSHLARLLTGNVFNSIRDGSKKLLSNVPPIKEFASRAEEHLKGMVVPGTIFEELGFNYIGPIDGHDVDAVVDTLRNMRKFKGPQLLHVVTKKGKGYALAEKDPIKFHAVPKFNPADNALPKAKPSAPTFSAIFGDWLCDMAAQDPKLMAVTPAMREGSGMVAFSQQYPEQYFDVAIAEQHAVTFAAGLARDGCNPVVAIYSTFLQRAYDQLIHDVALQDLPVLFAVDRAGIVGADGPTHQGAFDIAFLRCIPNMIVMAPSDENECRQMLYTGHKAQKPAAVRYPRGSGMGITPDAAMTELPIGKSKVSRAITGKPAKKAAILNFGTLLPNALAAGEAIDATVIDMRFVKPLDGQAIEKAAAEHDMLITLEDGCIAGGAGSGVLEYLQQQGIMKPVRTLGLPDSFILQGTQQEMYKEHGLDAEGITATLKSLLS